MNKFKTLVIIQAKDSLGKMQSSMNIRNRKLIIALQLFIVAAIILPAVNFAIITFDAYAALNFPEILLTTMYIAAVTLMFFLGIPFIVSVFFYSKDLEFLSTFPVREDVLIFAKLGTVYVYLFVISVFLMGPAFIVYGINMGFTLSYVLMALLISVLSPIIPMLISALLVLALSSLISKNKYRNILTIASNILLIIALLAVQMSLSRFSADPGELQALLGSGDAFLRVVGMRFPPSIWMTRMMLGSILDLFLFLSLNIALLLALQQLSRIVFHRSLASFHGGAAGSGRIYYSRRSRGWQLLKRNILIITKEATFFLNTLMSMVLPVIMYLVMSFSGEMSLELLQAEELKPFMTLILAAILISPAIVSNISSTAITREGKAFWQTKTIPISDQENIKYRIMTTLVVNFTGMLILLVLSLFVLTLSLRMILIALFFAITTTLFLGTIDFIINIYRPLLNWSNPTAAVKNNLNVTISLGIRAVIALLVYALYKVAPGLFVNFDLLLIYASIVFLALYLLSRYLIYNVFVKEFSRISI
ncbi:MAG: hypothetical protein ACOCQO_02575 [Halanaerobiaceae bacterium]